MLYIRRVNVASLDLNLLVALDALLQEESVSRGGQKIGLSQPAMSHALGKLRGLLADPLLVRTARSICQRFFRTCLEHSYVPHIHVRLCD